MTNDQLFWEERRSWPASPQRLDSALVVVFGPVDLPQRAAILAACDGADAIGYLTTGSRLTVWMRAEAVVAMLRGLGTVPQPVRISVPPTTHLRQDEIDRIRKVVGTEVDIDIQSGMGPNRLGGGDAQDRK